MHFPFASLNLYRYVVIDGGDVQVLLALCHLSEASYTSSISVTR